MSYTQPVPGPNWMFTWNNYQDESSSNIEALFKDGIAKYIVYQPEIAPHTGTPHLQGFIAFKKQQRVSSLRKLLPLVHWTKVVRGTVEDCIAYCQKENTRAPGAIPVEYGIHVNKSGMRCDLKTFEDDVKAGISYETLLQKHRTVYARSSKYFEKCFEVFRPKPVEDMSYYENRDWHYVVNDYISNPDKRSMLFIVDEDGGLGKTTYARYLKTTRSDVQYLKPEKESNIAHLLDPTKKIFIFDCPRSRLDIPLPYNTMEGIKDGEVVSGKYDSCMKSFTRPNVLIVFTNEAPDAARLSHDRWNVKYNHKGRLLDCKPTSDNRWDVMSDCGKHRLKNIVNRDVEKRIKKHEREEAYDEAMKNKRNRIDY